MKGLRAELFEPQVAAGYWARDKGKQAGSAGARGGTLEGGGGSGAGGRTGTPPVLSDLARLWVNSEAMRALADSVVGWDGAGEDGCGWCGGGYADEEKVGREAAYVTFVGGGVWSVVVHEKDCPVVAHRMALIDYLVSQDPAADSPEGQQLQRLAAFQSAFEKLVFNFGGK